MMRKLISTYIFPLHTKEFLICCALFFGIVVFSPVQSDGQTQKNVPRQTAKSDVSSLQSLYEARQCFKLRDTVLASKNTSTFYRGAVAAAFNNSAELEKHLQAVIEAAPQSSEAKQARTLLIYAYQRAGLYGRALAQIEQAIMVHPEIDGLQNARGLYAALSRFSEQSIAARRFSRIAYEVKEGNLFVPVEINGKAAKYIVDTGANLSVISESEARRLGLAVLDGSKVEMSDSSGSKFEFGIAVVERLSIGDTYLRNAAFLVIRDEQQPFVDLPQERRGIIGLPVLLALETIRWKSDGTFEIGFAAGRRDIKKSNLCFDGVNPVVAGDFAASKINIFLDTGATKTRATSLFARDFADFVNQFSSKTTGRITGVGGSKEVKLLRLPKLNFRVGGKEFVVSPAEVELNGSHSQAQRNHLWLGFDVLKRTKAVTIDFKSMTFAAQ